MDERVLMYFQQHVVPGLLADFMKFLSFLGDAGWFWIALTVLLFIFPKSRSASVASAVALIATLLLTNIILKNAVARMRPYEQYPDINVLIKTLSSYSFPSGHTSCSFAAAGALSYHLRRWALPFMLLASLIGFSRIYLSMHYLTDVLGGAFFGMIWAVIGILFGNFLQSKIAFLKK